MSERQCSAKLRGTGWGTTRACSRKATVEREGKAYCGVHDPDRVQARREKTEERWRAEFDKRTRDWKLDRLARELAELAIKEPSTFPPNAQPIVEQLLNLASRDSEK